MVVEILGHNQSRNITHVLFQTARHAPEYLELLVLPSMIQSSRVKWQGHVEHMGENRKACMVVAGNLKLKDHLEEPGQDERLAL
jgi:hypothetical protein